VSTVPPQGARPTGTPPRTAGQPPGDERSTSEVLTSLVANGQALAKKEIELAKLELQEVVRDKAIALGLAVVAAIFGLFVLAFIGVTAAAALTLVVAEWLAWLIVTVAYTVVVATALLIAVKLLKRPPFPRTKASVEETRDWAKGQVQR
jgi:hypothetical protein